MENLLQQLADGSYTGTGPEQIPSYTFSGVLGNDIRCE
jgi:hypothetical protein